jgi:hypothetical protein
MHIWNEGDIQIKSLLRVYMCYLGLYFRAETPKHFRSRPYISTYSLSVRRELELLCE